MKFFTSKSFFLLFVINYCTIIVEGTNNKKSETVMEYLENLFSANNNLNIANINTGNTVQKNSYLGAIASTSKNTVVSNNANKGKKHHAKKTKSVRRKHKKSHKFLHKKMRFAQQPVNTTNPDPNAVNQQPGSANITGNLSYLEDWLMVSTPAFKNRARFPPVNLLNGSQITINVDNNFFRYNLANCTPQTAPPASRYFWFRKSGINLYYSSSKTDINILGAIQISNINKISDVNDNTLVEGNQTHCFDIVDTEQANWKLCAQTVVIAKKWVCAIKIELNPLDNSCLVYKNITENITIIETTINQPIIIVPLPSPHCNENWNYQQNGADWECDCSEGKEQSPIDLPEIPQAVDSPVKPLFQYLEVKPKPGISTIDTQLEQEQSLKLKLLDHALRIFHHNMGKVVTLDGAVYFAEEIVIHTPAEHKINGKEYDMEVQIIHYGQSKGDIAKQLVLSFLVERTPGVYNQFFDDIDFFNLPNPITKEKDLENTLFIPKILYNTGSDEVAIMKPFSFYTYQGSLTFPPCTEQTIMYVASSPIKLGTTAIQLFQEALRIPDMMDTKGDVIVSNWLPINNRMLQELNGRPVFHYDSSKYCGPEPSPPPIKPVGHFEKVTRNAKTYFYVNGEKPSGLPGAFVVSEKEAKGEEDPNDPNKFNNQGDIMANN